MPQSETDSLLDVAHLGAQTFADPALEREVLALFEEQCARLGPLVCGPGSRGERADAAHTLKGAARAVGARRVAALAEALEAALAREGSDPAPVAAELAAAIAATRAAVAARRDPLASAAGLA